jgi:hypothetical protein
MTIVKRFDNALLRLLCGFANAALTCESAVIGAFTRSRFSTEEIWLKVVKPGSYLGNGAPWIYNGCPGTHKPSACVGFDRTLALARACAFPTSAAIPKRRF